MLGRLSGFVMVLINREILLRLFEEATASCAASLGGTDVLRALLLEVVDLEILVYRHPGARSRNKGLRRKRDMFLTRREKIEHGNFHSMHAARCRVSIVKNRNWIEVSAR